MRSEVPRITELVEHLSALADGEGRWSITAEEAARLLGMEPVAFWRALHEVRDRISFSDAIDGWDQDSAGDLVTLMEHLSGESSELLMTRAGLFLPYSRGIELIEELLWKARRYAASHEIRSDELAAMLRHTGNVRAAISIYLDSCTDLDAVIEESAESFRTLQGMPPRGRQLALRYLQQMFTRHVLDRAGLLAGLRERLVLEAARLGYIDPEDHVREEEGRRSHAAGSGTGRSRRGAETGGTSGETSGGTAPGGAGGRHAWARRVMGLDGREFSAEDLRAAYRRLMMRHHPDVDPGGLERCKDVNVAYALLIAEVSQRSP